jgi:hypothetical protein
MRRNDENMIFLLHKKLPDNKVKKFDETPPAFEKLSFTRRSNATHAAEVSHSESLAQAD